MKFGIIVGSMQNDSNSGKVGRYAAQQLEQQGHSSYTLDLGEQPLPMWDNSIWQGDEDWKAILKPISAELEDCDGFVVISPEYNGMVPSALKNFFLCFGKEVLGHKPGYIISVSASIGGTYPIAELRMSSYKNCRLCYIPEHTIVRNAGDILNGSSENDPNNNPDSDPFYRSQIGYCLSLLVEYSKALEQVRQSGVIDYKTYSNGM